MYREPKHIASWYNKNNIGKDIYNITIETMPDKIIDFGILYGYSTVCLAQAVRDNGVGHVYAYDLFEEYQYNNSVKDIVYHNLKYYELDEYVTFKKLNFHEWIKEHEDFDLLHLDISNDGNTILEVYEKYPDSKIIFEGGTYERDLIEWMRKYKRKQITSIKDEINYRVINEKFPALSGVNV